MADRSAAQPWNSLLRSRWHAFALWWLAGLHDTLPTAWRRWFLAAGGPSLVIEQTADGCLCRAVESAERPFPPKTGRSGAEALAAYLAQAGLRRDEVTVGFLIDEPLFFTRDIAVPDMAMDALPRLLDQEVLRRTPFRLSDVLHGATTLETPMQRGVTNLRHWIIRRDFVEAAMRNAGLDREHLDTLLTRDDEETDRPVIRIAAAPTRDRPWVRQAVGWAAGAACLGTVLALIAVDQTQEAEAARTATALADTRAQIQGSNGATDNVGLLTLKADIGMAAILSELSKVMPDDTFLTELRIADGKIEAAGFSGEAARLVRLVDGSPLLKGASLVGAIEPNPTEGKEHFAIKAELRTGQMLRLRAATNRPRAARPEGLPP